MLPSRHFSRRHNSPKDPTLPDLLRTFRVSRPTPELDQLGFQQARRGRQGLGYGGRDRVKNGPFKSRSNRGTFTPRGCRPATNSDL